MLMLTLPEVGMPTASSPGQIRSTRRPLVTAANVSAALNVTICPEF
jgi:hypothetical protein